MAARSELDLLFSGLSGFKEDAMEYGVTGLGAAAGYFAGDFVMTKFRDKLPAGKNGDLMAAGGLAVGGVLVGSFSSKAKQGRAILGGVAAGLIANGLLRAKAALMPSSTVAGYGDDYAFGAAAARRSSGVPTRRLLYGMDGAPTLVETTGMSDDYAIGDDQGAGGGMGSAPTLVQENDLRGMGALAEEYPLN